MNFGIGSAFSKGLGSAFSEGPGPGPLYKVCPYLACTSSTFKLVVLLHPTPKATTSLIHPSLTKQAEDVITVCTFSVKQHKDNVPSFLTFLAFSPPIIFFFFVIFTNTLFDSSALFLAPSFPFNPSNNRHLILIVKSSVKVTPLGILILLDNISSTLTNNRSLNS